MQLYIGLHNTEAVKCTTTLETYVVGKKAVVNNTIMGDNCNSMKTHQANKQQRNILQCDEILWSHTDITSLLEDGVSLWAGAEPDLYFTFTEQTQEYT